MVHYGHCFATYHSLTHLAHQLFLGAAISAISWHYPQKCWKMKDMGLLEISAVLRIKTENSLMKPNKVAEWSQRL